jgi:GDPmannose 4,6-dehydratase
VAAACNIAQGNSHQLQLGNVSIKRDWGWAPEYIKAMYLMLQQTQADDYVIATGHSYSLEDFVAETFNCLGLNWQDYVITDESLFRPTDITYSCGNPGKAQQKLGWKAQYKMPDVVKMMVENRLNKSKG